MIPPPINPLTGTAQVPPTAGPVSVWNPGYESCVLPSAAQAAAARTQHHHAHHGTHLQPGKKKMVEA